MADSWKPVLSVAIALDAPVGAPIVLRGPLSQTVNVAADIGFDGVELHFRQVDEVDWEELRSLLRRRNLTLTSIGTGRLYTVDGLSLSDSRADVVEAAERRLEAMIDEASAFGADVIVGSVRGTLLADGPEGQAGAYGRLVAALARLSSYAERRGCRLVVEAISRSEMDSINNTHQLLELLDDVGSPNVMAHLDTYHLWMEDQDIVGSLRLAGAKLGHVHFADSKRVAPGNGNLNFVAILQTLKEMGYSRTIAFEYPPMTMGRRPEGARRGPTAEEQFESALLGLCHVKACLEAI